MSPHPAISFHLLSQLSPPPPQTPREKQLEGHLSPEDFHLTGRPFLCCRPLALGPGPVRLPLGAQPAVAPRVRGSAGARCPRRRTCLPVGLPRAFPQPPFMPLSNSSFQTLLLLLKFIILTEMTLTSMTVLTDSILLKILAE